MSKTVDELHEIYRNARLGEIFAAKDEELVTDVRERAERAGIAAVVRALRDEYTAPVKGCETVHTSMSRYDFNEILASDGDGKAAGGSTREDEQGDGTTGATSAVAASTPAAAPVCEWTELSFGRYLRSCSKYPTENTEGEFCFNCGKKKVAIKSEAAR